MLDVAGVHKFFGRFHAVRGVSFRVTRGEVVGLLGPNGAGKTTTIRMITGFLPPDRGAVTIDGKDTVEDSAEARRRVGYLPESAPLYAEMTPRAYLMFRAELFGLSRASRRDAVGRVLERCWIRGVADKRISQLSKGYRQRVALAGALLHDPPLLVLDEPTNALDPSQVRETRRLIRELGSDRVVLLSSHVLAEVEMVCSRVVIIARGTVRADGVPSDLVARGGASAASTGGPSRRAGIHTIEWRDTRPTDTSTEDRLARTLRAIPGVASCAIEPTHDGWVSCRIESADDSDDLREPLARVMRESGVLVRHLSRQTPTLERLFVDLVESTDGAATAEGMR
jgi:ABC-2 type transport system ATP-binding protein